MISTRTSAFLTSWTTYQSQTSTIQSVFHEKPQSNPIHIQLSTLEKREIGRTSRKQEEEKMSTARRMEEKNQGERRNKSNGQIRAKEGEEKIKSSEE